jgi:hypothetical protein
MFDWRKWLLPGLLAAVFSNVLASSFPKTANSAENGAGPVGRTLFNVRLPLAFEENHGQAGPNVRFLARGSGYGLYLQAEGAIIARPSESPLRLTLAGAREDAQLVAGQMLPGKSNYFFGNDPAKWITGVAQYSSITYQQVYPGVDLVYHGDNESGGRLEYDFVVAPGADPSRILLAFDSPTYSARPSRLALDGGDLLLVSGHSAIRQLRPRVYQDVRGHRREIPGRYVIAGDRTVRFELGEYDRGTTLVIDPVLIYGTVIPGSGNDSGLAVAADAAGNAYVTGYTSSSDFLTASPLQAQSAGGKDVFVSKVNAAGTALVYSTYIGGSGDDQAQGIAVDSSGNVYVAGWTSSGDFPTHAPLQASLLGIRNAFALKLNAAGSALVYSTYLGGSASDQANGIAIDSTGAAYLTGSTSSTNFPVVSALHGSLAASGATNAFITKINAAGTALAYSTYLGGSQSDSGAAIAVDASGNAVITGSATSPDFPVAGAVQASYAGSGDAFIAKLNAAGSALLFSTFYGGSGQDNAYGVALDPSGNIYVSGFTNAIGAFPVVNAMPAPPVAASGFLLKLNSSGSAVAYATILNDNGKGVAVDSYGNAYVSYISRVNASGTGLDFSLPLSGTIPNAIALDSSGNVYVTGYGATIVAPPLANPKNFYNVSLVKESEPAGGPRVGYITPASALAGSSAVTVRIMGTGFAAGAAATLNGSARTTTFVGATEVDVALTTADLATATVDTLLVTNPSPNVPSNPVVFTVQNLVPTISSVSPASAVEGSAAFTLTVNGTGFVAGSAICWNGSPLNSTVVSSTQMTATVPAASVAAAASVKVQVQVPAPGGGFSAASTFTVNNPLPAISSLSPSSTATGGAAFLLTVQGSNFTSSSVVQWNGTSRSTTFIGKTQLQASMLASDIAAAGSYTVTVITPAPGGGTSAGATFAVTGAAPAAISSLTPASTYAGSAAFTLTVNGSGFLATSQVQWKGASRTTTYVSATQLTAAITAADVTAVGSASVNVVNPSNSTTSQPASFTINPNPNPQLTSLQPSSVATGIGAFTLTLNGSGFVSTSVVQWNGSSRATTVVNSTQLTAAITAADLTNAFSSGGTAAVTVVNPLPGGGTSGAQQVTVDANPTPTLASILPATAPAGAGATTITVTGSGFLPASVVRWNGASRATSYVSSTQLTATVTTTDLSTAAANAVTVVNPASAGVGGGASAAATFTVSNPLPALATLTPPSVMAASGAFTLSVNGSGFVAGSQVQWNGANRTTTYVSAAQLTAAITAADVAASGTATVTVVNATPGGGTSTGLTFSVVANPVPAMAALVPSTVSAGSGAFTLTVTGSGFVGSSVVQWNGSPRTTTLVSPTQITAAITSADVATAGTSAVTVQSPAPGGGTSAAMNFSVTNPSPVIAALSPASIAVGSSAFTLTITGTGFVNGSQAQWNGATRSTTYVTATQLTAAITAADVAAGGMAAVTVINAAPGGGTSLASSFAIVSNPVPQIASILPASAGVGSGAFTLTVTGSGFLAGSLVQWNGASRTTTYISATQLTAAITNADLSAAGTATVTVANPAPGGGASAGASFAIANPTPAITTISPSTVSAASSAFSLSVNGAGFVATSVVQWNGNARATTYVSATQLTATISAADIATAGTASVSVVNPTPGGGTSGALPLAITANPTPTLSSILPTSAINNSGAFTLSVSGSGFIPASQVQWNGSSRVTTYVSPTQLSSTINAADLSTVGTAAVTVMSPAPGGGTSSGIAFTVAANPAPSVNSILPTAATIGATGFSLSVAGSGFISSSQVLWNGANRATTYVSSTQLTAAILTSDLTTAGTATVTVSNPTPGGGTTGGVMFTISANPTPSVASILPAAATSASGAFTLTVIGSNFVAGSLVQWNGASRATTFVSTTQLTAAILGGDLSVAGTSVVTVLNPSNGGTSGGAAFTVNNPAPSLSSIAPTSAAAGAAGFTLTVNGNSFVATSVVQWNGSNRTTAYVNNTQLTATILAGDVATAGPVSITVMNPTPGGGTSTAIAFAISANPAPSVASILPSGASAGSGAQVITVTGSGFIATSQVQWGGSNRATTYVSSTQLTAAILAADVATAGTAAVAVVNPAPGGGTSMALTFSVTNPAPTVGGLSPASIATGSVAFTLIVTGSGFVTASQVQWNGAARTTTFVSATQLTAAITAADVAAAGTSVVTVVNPGPGGGNSAGLSFAITSNPAPMVASILPSSASAGSVAFMLTVTGSGFVNGSQVQWGGANRSTTFISSTQITAAIPAADVAAAATAAVTVVNSAPGGGTSAAATFTINNPSPAIASLSPATVVSGASAISVTVTGTGFVAASIVQWNGLNRSTTFTSATQISAAITAADLASAGSATVTVVNPAPGGGTSSGAAFVISAQANPAPVAASISPAAMVAGSSAITLIVNGSGFLASSQVLWNGSSRATNYASATQLSATIPATDLLAAGTASVTVTNPTPGGGTSAGLTFTINNPAPAINTITPPSVAAQSAGFTLTVNGTGFVSSSVVYWAGSSRVTSYVSSTQLTASINNADVAAVGAASITVVNGTPGGGTSAAATFTVTTPANPVPVTTTISPNTANVSNGAFTLIVNGSGFLMSSQVQWNGANRTTTYVSATQLNAAISAADLASVGADTVTVVNPANAGGGGGTSLGVTFTVTANPAPSLASIVPASASVGAAALSLTITGSGFVPNSQVQWNGGNRATTYIGSTQLTAAVTAADLSTAGNSSVTVVNPAPGGGTSAAATFTVNNPSPSIASIAPVSATAGSAAFTLTVNGGGFIASSTVQWNGANRATTYVSATQVTAAITAADVASAGTATVTVTNPAPGGGNSAGLSFAITTNPAPVLSGIQPASAAINSGSFTLTVNGSGFIAASQVQWGAANRATTFVSSTQLTAMIPASDLSITGTAAVTVLNPAPGGGTSAAASFTITSNPAPTVASIVPGSASAASEPFTLTVTGSGFIPTSQVQWGGANRTTTYVSATQLTASITAADVATAGTAPVTVLNPTPGGGTSSASTFTINNPAPSLATISPASATTGSAAFMLTLNGSSFVPASQVRWNGANRTTTFVSATQLTAAITAADIAADGTATVTVINPAPGGGTSAGATFTTTSNPAPVLAAIQPSSAAINAGAFTLIVSGSSFTTNSIVQWNGASRATTFVSAAQLTALISVADISATGTAAVTVVTPSPGGGTSATVSFTITPNPPPVLASILPASANAGAGAFTLTVTGAGFLPVSQVQWNGVNRGTTFVSATQLTAAITIADLAAAGMANVTVVNPTPGGGTSAAGTFSINNPAPAVTQIAPASAVAASGAFTLTVTGSGFTAVSTLQWNGGSRVTTYVSGTQLTAAITAADVASAGTATVTVVNPAPGGGTAGGVSFAITANPMPVLNALQPSSAPVNSSTLTLTVNGNGFVPASQVQCNGTSRATNFVSSTQLTATIPAGDLTNAGSATMTVVNPGPGGGTSAGATFTVTPNPAPVLASIVPASAAVGSAAFTLTVTGSAFVSSSLVQWNGASRATTYVSATQLTAAITAADVAAAGTAVVTVLNPASGGAGGGTSAAVSFTIGNPAPSLATIFPASAATGSPAFTLTVNGSGFVAASQVQWNGSNRVTTFAGSTQLNAAITAADVAAAAIATVTVVNPAPGGGTSSAASFTISSNPAPSIASVLPASTGAGSAAFTITVTGTGFTAASQVQWNGASRTTTFSSATQLTAAINAADVATAATAAVTVVNPAPGGGASAVVPFSVTNPAPVIASIAPATVAAGSPALNVTINGSGFVAGSQVQWNGANRTTTYAGATQLTATITAADLSSAGSASITVGNAAPGGGTSSPATFSITANPVPTLASIVPVSAALNSASFTLTVIGSGFTTASQVLWNGAARGTTYVSASELTAAITASDLVSAGAATVTVASPAPGGGTSAGLTFTIGNPTPALTVIAPSSAAAGSSAFTLTVTGTGFIATSQVQWNGSNRATTFVNGTQLTAQITAADLSTSGAATVTVLNPTPVGGLSGGLSFAITSNPAPAATGMQPSSATINSGAFTLSVTGSGFVTASQVQWNGTNCTTTFVSSTLITAAIPANALATPGTATVSVVNPAPGGGASSGLPFTIGSNPAPSLASILPASANYGSGALTLTVTGSGFLAGATGSQVQWNGANRATTYVSATQLIAAITAADLNSAGTAAVTVVNPAPGGGVSPGASFTIGNPAPTITSLSPATVATGSAAFTIAITGSGFLTASVVQWNGTNRATTYVSATQLTAAITAADSNTAGTASLTVVNPAPGGGVSSGATFTIGNPAPTIASLSPGTVTTGSAAFTMAVTGSGFLPSSVVQWNGTNRASTFVSATQLTAAITAADVNAAGAATVAVANPAPGGGVSSGATLTIVNPAPVITLLSPSNVIAGSAAFTLTVTGSGFQASSVVQCNGTNRTTTYVSATQLAVAITAADVSTAGNDAITVTTPAPGGGTSTSAPLVIGGNPAPWLAALLPASAAIGSGSFNVAVLGVGFTTQSVVQWNGANRVTTYVSTTEVTAVILASDLSATGTALVTVTNPAPGGGTSGPDLFTVTGTLNPVPSITSLSPPSAAVNTGDFTLTVNGAGFVGGSQVQWNGTNLATTYVSASQLTAAVSGASLSSAGSAAVTVVSPLPGGGTSNSETFAVNLVCSVAVTPPSGTFPATASSGTVSVAAAPGCVWSAASLNSYLTITSGLSGSGNGTVSFALTADDSSARTGTLVIAGQNVIIAQDGTMQGVVSVSPAAGTPGGAVRVPVTLVANSGISADKIAFSLQVTPNGSAPALSGTLSFAPDNALGTPTTTDTSGGAGLLSVGWLSPATTVGGTQHLGDVLITTPSTAAVGHTYSVQVTGASASLASSSVALSAGSSSTVTISLDYLVGDDFPYTSDSAGNFGDGTLNTLDLIYALRAITNITGFVPARCSDRFDSMDAFPQDTSSTRGGDGVLNTLDLVTLLRRITNIDPGRPRRVSRGLTCSQATPQARRAPQSTVGSLEAASDGSVYLIAKEDLSLDGLAISISSASDTRLTWTAADGLSPALTDSEMPGGLAIAWIQKIEVRSGDRLLLGKAAGADRFAIVGASANSGTNDVPLDTAQRKAQ